MYMKKLLLPSSGIVWTRRHAFSCHETSKAAFCSTQHSHYSNPNQACIQRKSAHTLNTKCRLATSKHGPLHHGGVGSGKVNTHIQKDSVQRITGMKMGKVCNFLDKQRDTPRLWMCQVDIIATDETFSMLVTSISFHGSGDIFDDGCLFFKHWRI